MTRELYNSNGKEINSFLGNISPIEGHNEDPATIKEFWLRDDNNKAEFKRIKDNNRHAHI